MSDVEQEQFWPLQRQLDELEAHNPDDVRGADRLGQPLQFTEAPGQLARVIRDLKDLKLEEWDDLPTQAQTSLPDTVAQINTTIEEMKKLTSAAPNAAATKEQLQNQLNGLFQTFRAIVHPLIVRARVRDEVSGMSAATEAHEQAAALRDTIRQLEGEAAILRENLDRLAPVAEAQREIVGESGAAELSNAYAEEGKRHEDAWRGWLIALVAAVVIAAVGGLAFVALLDPPEDATDAQVITAIARDVLFVGLLLYAVRITSLQFRVHRHLEAVARNKAAALRTFNRIVAGQTDPEVRAAVAAALAHAVFASEQTGFIGSTEDHVTLVERVIGPISQRASGG